MILHENVKYGDVVYCEETQQVYMVEGWNYNHDKLALKNLLNLECPMTHIAAEKLCDLPDNWSDKSFYETMAKNIVKGRNR